jgi:hypothetical protein
MREVISDIVKQSIGLFDTIKITGTPEQTKIQGVSKTKFLFIEGLLKTPATELQGEFGMSNLTVLRGLLNFSTYKTEESTFAVKRMTNEQTGSETVEQIEFGDGKGAEAIFRCMNSRIPEQAEIKNIPWDVSFKPSKSKLAEFQELSKLYGVVSKMFSAKTENGNLLFTLGDENSSMHRASIIIDTDVDGELTGGLMWEFDDFFRVLDLATEPSVKISSRGVMSVEADTQFGAYKYFMRAQR